MISKQKVFIIITAVSFLFLILNISKVTSETNNYQMYVQALKEYNNNDYSQAYHTFGRVSGFSKLKSAAVFRQALCADKLGDEKTELRKYKEVIRRYPHSILAVRAKYLKAQQYYELDKKNKAEKDFKGIVTGYAGSDYAIASQYYLGSIELEKASKTKNKKRKTKYQNKAIQYFKTYLKNAPSGRFSLKCVEKWTALNKKLTNEDNLLIVKTYQLNQKYKKAQKYLSSTNLSISWPYFVKNAYALKDYSKVKYYTVEGLKGKWEDDVLINIYIDEKTQHQDIYEAIDDYLKVSNDPRTSISYLLGISKKAKGHDYLLYKHCNNLSAGQQTACFNTLFYEYPEGQFAAEALANIFYDKVKSQKYFMAKRIGQKHLSKYPNSNSAPKVMFWLARVANRTKNYEESRIYYKTLLKQYPDDYYAYRAFMNLNRFKRFQLLDLDQKPIEFPYKNLGYGLITELAKVKDYGLIDQLCKDNDFIQSWLDYLQGDFTTSARLARDAMEKLPYKPDRLDPRWRLVYPIHYYSDIEQSAKIRRNDPVLILSIIREESYFNPKAKSAAGARGLMQLMPESAREASNISGISLPNMNLLFDPYINIRLGNIYYARLKRALSSKDFLAVMAYNGGIGSVSRWKGDLNYLDADEFIEQIPYFETQNYLKKVYRTYWNYLRVYDGIR